MRAISLPLPEHPGMRRLTLNGVFLILGVALVSALPEAGHAGGCSGVSPDLYVMELAPEPVAVT